MLLILSLLLLLSIGICNCLSCKHWRNADSCCCDFFDHWEPRS